MFFGTFLVPIYLILIVNFIIFIPIVRVLIRNAIRRRKMLARDDKKGKAEVSVKTAMGVISVSVVFGLGWVFGAFTVEDAADVFRYLFVICNVFQGFVFFVFIVIIGPDGREFWRTLLRLQLRKMMSFSSTGKTSQGMTSSTKVPIVSTLQRTSPITKNSCGMFVVENSVEVKKHDEANSEEMQLSRNTLEMNFTNQGFAMEVGSENSHSETTDEEPESALSTVREAKILMDFDSGPDTIAVTSPDIADTQIDFDSGPDTIAVTSPHISDTQIDSDSGPDTIAVNSPHIADTQIDFDSGPDTIAVTSPHISDTQID